MGPAISSSSSSSSPFCEAESWYHFSMSPQYSRNTLRRSPGWRSWWSRWTWRKCSPLAQTWAYPGSHSVRILLTNLLNWLKKTKKKPAKFCEKYLRFCKKNNVSRIWLKIYLIYPKIWGPKKRFTKKANFKNIISHLLLHPEQQVPPLLPEPVYGALRVDVPLACRLKPGQVSVLLTHCTAQGFLPVKIISYEIDLNSTEK